jgi:uncharacterized protein YegP (UPF0339 family)
LLRKRSEHHGDFPGTVVAHLDDNAGEFRFRLKAANEKIIATGVGQVAKGLRRDGNESVKVHAPGAAVVDNTT